jgi:glycosyltransferase involved in cell wall biosynthesis
MSGMNEPLHIAMVVRSFSTGGGLELYTHKVIEGLLAQGFKVTVICQEQKTELAAANLSVVLFSEPDKRLPKWQKLEHQFKAATEAAARSGPFDLIHTQHFPIDGANVVTFHNHSVQHLSKVGTGWENLLNKGKELFAPAYKARDRYDRILCQNAGSFIFPSHVCRNDFRAAMKSSCDLDITPYVVAHPGADLESENQFATTAQLPARGSLFTFLFVGRGYRRKGLDTVLKACSILRRKGKSFKLQIAGLSKKPIDSLRLNILGIAADVEYLGFRQDMDNVYKQARAFVMPSRHDVFGMAPLQAMHRGLPPIVSRCMGVSELLTDRQNALILDNHLDAGRLADLMTDLMDDSALYERLRSHVTAVAQSTSWNNCVEATLEAYRLAVHSKCPVDNNPTAAKR